MTADFLTSATKPCSWSRGRDPMTGENPAAYFVCQIDNPAHVEAWSRVLKPDMEAKERHWCAMCCVRSLLLAERLDAPSVEELFDRACEFGVYKSDAESVWSGAYHKELADFVSTLHPKRAHAVRNILLSASNNPCDLRHWVVIGHRVLLSVHPEIRARTYNAPPDKRGHFVFVYGYEEVNGVGHFLLHNPAGFMSENSQICFAVSAQRMAQVSDGKGVVVHSRFWQQHLW
jgi:hypothetical protein